MVSDRGAALTAYRLLIADVYELAGASRRTSETLAHEAGQTAARWHVLRRLGLARQSVHRVVDDLATAEQVELIRNPDHARAPLVQVTAAGQLTLRTLVRRSDKDRAELLDRAGVDTDDLDAARCVLRALTAVLNRTE